MAEGEGQRRRRPQARRFHLGCLWHFGRRHHRCARTGIARGGVRPVEEASVNPKEADPIRRVLSELYDVWVKKTRLFGAREPAGRMNSANGNQALLDTGDVKSGQMPVSLLNSEALTRIARESLISIKPTGAQHAFFTNPTHLFLTHTNLDGIPYPIAFEEDVY